MKLLPIAAVMRALGGRVGADASRRSRRPRRRPRGGHDTNSTESSHG